MTDTLVQGKKRNRRHQIAESNQRQKHERSYELHDRDEVVLHV